MFSSGYSKQVSVAGVELMREGVAGVAVREVAESSDHVDRNL